jgi:hypothetical protein
MRHVEKFSYRKRMFLMPVSTGIPSYVLADVESSNGGEYRSGTYVITLADCRRQIELEFSLATARDRRHSLAKIDLLLDVFIEFGKALQKEAQLIADGSQKANRQKRKRRKAKP